MSVEPKTASLTIRFKSPAPVDLKEKNPERQSDPVREKAVEEVEKAISESMGFSVSAERSKNNRPAIFKPVVSFDKKGVPEKFSVTSSERGCQRIRVYTQNDQVILTASESQCRWVGRRKEKVTESIVFNRTDSATISKGYGSPRITILSKTPFLTDGSEIADTPILHQEAATFYSQIPVSGVLLVEYEVPFHVFEVEYPAPEFTADFKDRWMKNQDLGVNPILVMAKSHMNVANTEFTPDIWPKNLSDHLNKLPPKPFVQDPKQIKWGEPVKVESPDDPEVFINVQQQKTSLYRDEHGRIKELHHAQIIPTPAPAP